MQVHVLDSTIEIAQGDITDERTDAIVNAANNHFWMGGGVAGAIKHRGGIEIEQEAVAKGPVEVGEAVMTSAGKLSARFVIHAAVMGQDLHTDADKIRKTTRRVLRLAEESKCRSLSLPALGTGVGGFSVFHCANIMISEAVEFLSSPERKNLKAIRFVLFDKPAFDAFQDELKLQFSARRH